VNMGNRYSHATYSIIHHARLEAEALGVPNGLCTKHLLLALLYDSQSKAVRTLTSLGVDVRRIWLEVEIQAHLQDETPLPVVPDEETRQAIEQLRDVWREAEGLPKRNESIAYFRECRRLTLDGMHPARQAVFSAYNHLRNLADSDRVEPHHLLLALIREKDGLASRVFARLNLSFTRVYEALKRAE
jgi:ATP-dependent Clp protease ATP-binding subunit ClpA